MYKNINYIITRQTSDECVLEKNPDGCVFLPDFRLSQQHSIISLLYKAGFYQFSLNYPLVHYSITLELPSGRVSYWEGC